MLTVSRLFCYPVKSLRGFAVDELEIAGLGPRYDRQWVVVDERGMFLAQRADRGRGVAIREMSLMGTRIVGDQLWLDAPPGAGARPLAVPLDGHEGPTVDVSIWSDIAAGTDQGPEARAWLTEVLGAYRPGTYRLVRMPDQGTRRTTQDDAAVSYADGYPLLVASEASLDDLNRRIRARRVAEAEAAAADLGWERFRPNLVIDGAEPYAEDAWRTVSVRGRTDVRFVARTLCQRCPIPTIHPATATRGVEPLRTLATYRRNPEPDKHGVVFGRNLTHQSTGTIAVGDPVAVT